MRGFRLVRVLLLAVMLLPLSAGAEMLIRDGYVRGMPPGQQVTAAFMRLQNTGEKDLVIVAASSDVAARVEIHRHRHVDGMMRMEQVDSITVPAGKDFVLQSGGYHLMMFELQRPLQDNDQVNIELQAADGQRFAQQVPVRSVLAEPSGHNSGHHHGGH